MTILWVSLYPPLPLNFGGPIGIYHRIKELFKNGNSIYLFYINDDKNLAYDKKLSIFCKEVHSYNREKVGLKLFVDCMKYPYTVATRNIGKMQDDIEFCIINNQIDIINIEFPQMCVNVFPALKKHKIPTILHEHNNEWNRFSQMADSSKGFRRVLLKWESKKLLQFERELERKHIIDYYSFLSTEDQKKHIEVFNVEIDRTILVPLGGELHELEEKPHDGFIFMFCAAMDSEMNEEAAVWFAQKVFSRIDDCNVKLYLVGRNPNERVKSLGNEKIIVTGAVDSLDDYYAIADVIVIPLLHGGGVKVKLLEAIERCKIIITTPIGNEGTLFDFRHLLIANNAEEFRDYCEKVINNKIDVNDMKKRMRSFFLDNYTWKTIGQKYNSNLNAICEMRASNRESDK